jgi:hypothetical protein
MQAALAMRRRRADSVREIEELGSDDRWRVLQRANAYDGDRRLLTLQHLVVVPAGGRGEDGVTGAEVQASAIIRMARAATGAHASDRFASRRRRSLGRF